MLSYVINLDRDKDRLAHMTAEANRIGLALERFTALDGCHLSADLRGQFYGDDGRLHEPAMTPGEVGCYASHLSVLKLVAGGKSEAALIFEDDVQMLDGLAPSIAAAMAVAPGWDIIRLSNATKSVALSVAPLGGGRELVKYWTVPNSAGAYLISRAGAEKFLRAYERRTLPIDEDLRRPWRSGMNTYGILPPPVVPDVCMVSSICSMGRPRRVPARSRFKDAAPARDFLASWSYRLKTFGPWAFCQALVREPLAVAAARIVGREASRRICVMPPSVGRGDGQG
ncbi:MAG: glycosyltransferase family 25 protein [Hyphomicrobium sp.]|jgi:glycosyl transferase family 25